MVTQSTVKEFEGSTEALVATTTTVGRLTVVAVVVVDIVFTVGDAEAGFVSSCDVVVVVTGLGATTAPTIAGMAVLTVVAT